MRRDGQQRAGGVDPDEEIDENFWARAAADRAEGGQDLQLGNSRLLRLDNELTFQEPMASQYHSKRNSSMMTGMTVGTLDSVMPTATVPQVLYLALTRMKICGPGWKVNKYGRRVPKMSTLQRKQRGWMSSG